MNEKNNMSEEERENKVIEYAEKLLELLDLRDRIVVYERR